MYDMAASGLGAGAPGSADAEAVELRRALETQLWELDAVLARFTQARALLPRNPNGGRHSGIAWKGLAHLLYEIGLDQLGAELERAHDQLGSAIQQSRRAIESLDRRVG